MRKDREFTITRESTTKSSRPAGRLSVSLTEALLGDSPDPLMSLHEGVFLNEKRAEMPGSNKNDKKFLDQHPEVRELANGVGRGKTTPFNIDIEGIPDKRIEITNNQNGIPRIYSNSGEARSWRSDKRTTAAMQEPVIEITPAATPSSETGPGDEEDTGAETSTNPTTVDPDVTDDDQEDLDADVRQAQDSADERWQTVKDREDSEREYDSTFSGPGGERIPPPEPDGRETFVDDGGGDMDPDDPRLKDPQAASSEEEGTGRPPGEPEDGDVIDGPPDGQGGGGQPPPPPTGDAKAVSDYIDQVAVGTEVVYLSEIRRPLHKRSLVELLYSS
jgi:hypothetical protein